MANDERNWARACAAVFLLAATILTSGASAADIASSPTFTSGQLVLQYKWTGKGASGSAGAHELYLKKDWVALVEYVVAQGYASDLYYFYLGKAAQELGRIDAAMAYYALSMEGQSCKGIFSSCQGFSFPKDARSAMDYVQYELERSLVTEFVVRGPDEVAVAGANVQLTVPRQAPSNCVTNAAGACSLSFVATRASEVSAAATKDGWIPSIVKVDLGNDAARTDIKLFSNKHYYCDALRGQADQVFPIKLGAFAAQLVNAAETEDTRLEARGICTTTLKQKQYMSLQLTHGAIFNEIKLNNYAIAVEVFDSVIRKMLPLLAQDNALGEFDGVDITIVTGKKNFRDEISTNKTLVYRFYLPIEGIQQYREKDITWQQLVAKSIVLLNDERIDLKLQ